MNSEFMQMIKTIIKEYPVLSAEEEKRLLIEYKNNPTDQLKGKIALHNVSYVLKIAGRYNRSGKNYDLEDLFSEGMLGLMTGIERFDLSKNLRLSTYVTYWIKMKIERYITSKSESIYFPEHLRIDYARLTKLKEKIASEEERERFFSCDEISLFFPELTNEKALTLAEMQSPKVISMNIHVGENDEAEYGLFLEDPDAKGPEEQIISKKICEIIHQVMDRVLTDREKLVIMRRMGFGEYKVETLESIAKDLNLSRERVRQIESKALKKLKHNKQVMEIGSANTIGCNVFI